MFSLLVFVSCVFAASASKCCIPPQWTAATTFVTTVIHEDTPRTIVGRATMAYDGINHVIGQYVTESIDGKEETYGVLQDYNTGMRYLYIVKDQKCVKTKSSRTVDTFGGCIPDNATTFTPESVYGLGSNAMHLTWYQLEYPGVIAYVGLTTDGCVPAMEVTRGNLDGNLFLENVHYFNITVGISHPEQLQSPPIGCENAQLLNDHFTEGNFNPSMVGRRSLFSF